MSEAEVTTPQGSFFQRMPRAIQWALLAALGFVLFWVWNEYMQPLADRWDKEATAIEGRVKEIRSSQALTSKLQAMQEVAVTLGPVATPTTEKEGAAALNEAINGVLQKNGATNQSFSFRSRGRLSKTALVGITRGTQRIDRLTGDLKFDATPKNAAAIIAELESNPEIEAVDSIRMTRDTGGKVKVHVTLEAWVISTESSKGEAI